MVMYRSLPRRMLGFQNVPFSGPGLPQGAMGPNPEAPLSALYPAASTYQSIRAQPAGVFITPNNESQQQAVTPLPPGANPMRLALAKQMLATGSSTAPVMSPLEGLARALQGGIGGYIAGQENRADEARQAALGGRMASLFGLDPAMAEGLSPELIATAGADMADAAAARAKSESKAKETGFKEERNLRKEYEGLSEDFRIQRDAYKRVLSSADKPTPAGDLALIFNYMKVLDPGSVVRESEFATAASTGAFGERIKAAVDRVATGKRLTDAQRADFVSRAGALYGGAVEGQLGRAGMYRELAEAYGRDPDRVVPDYIRGLQPLTVDEATVMAGGDPMVKSPSIAESFGVETTEAGANGDTGGDGDLTGMQDVYTDPDTGAVYDWDPDRKKYIRRD